MPELTLRDIFYSMCESERLRFAEYVTVDHKLSELDSLLDEHDVFINMEEGELALLDSERNKLRDYWAVLDERMRRTNVRIN